MHIDAKHSKHGLIAIWNVVLLLSFGATTAEAQTVSTPAGTFPAARYQGSTEDGVRVFRGIRYAAAPVADRRWAAPVPPAPQNEGQTVDATHFGNVCPQKASPFGIASTLEDCLFLNVFVPDGPAERLPVIVFFHGGAFVYGASDLYDAKQLAKTGNAIVVTVNYRLGALGFLATPELSSLNERRVSGNYGVLDQELALRWVQQNVAAFGGNPRDVTAMGESAGAFSLCAHLVRPSAAGLFSRVILESGPCAFPFPALSNTESGGSTFTNKAGCSRATAQDTVKCLRELTTEQVLDAQPTSAELTSPSGLTTFFPTVEGVVIPQQPQQALSSGSMMRVPVLSGTNYEEGRLFVALAFDLERKSPLTSQEYPDQIAATAKTLVEKLSGMGSPLTERVLTQQILNEYPLSDYTSPGEALAAVIGDGTFSCAAQFSHQLFSLTTPTYAYEFAERGVQLKFLPPASFAYGATHTAELPFLFELSGVDLTPDEQRLSSSMQSYWGQFARTGVPALGLPVQPAWLPYTIPTPVLQNLVAPAPGVETGFADRHHCNFWQGILLQTTALTALTNAGG